ncbi:hypothetical protein HH308_15565 [Gordonia sp. TBRC 11910]|uniref:Uncharacterized protein n=1 Tax=Gordonia asplenii TaxID=2725283 RepID=A0A848KVP2_9ACTN|nr:hypothetical protein [Gordonia asplenii]
MSGPLIHESDPSSVFRWFHWKLPPMSYAWFVEMLPSEKCWMALASSSCLITYDSVSDQTIATTTPPRVMNLP